MQTRHRLVVFGLLCFVGTACAQRTFDQRPSETPPAPSPTPPAVEEVLSEELVGTETEQVRFVRGNRYLGTCVEEPSGVTLGVVDDLFIDSETGEIMFVEVVLQAPSGEISKRFLPFGALSWNAHPDLDSAALVEVEDVELPKDTSDLAVLFDGQLTSKVSGEIIAIQPVGRDGQVAIAKVLDEDNILHRILIEPVSVATKTLPWLIVGKHLEVEGVETRDRVGRLIIARSLTQVEETLYLRGKRGTIQWETLARKFKSLSAMGTESVRLVDGATYEISGWIIDVDLQLVSFLCIAVGDFERALPWEELILRTEEGWRVARDQESILELPRVIDNLIGLVKL